MASRESMPGGQDEIKRISPGRHSDKSILNIDLPDEFLSRLREVVSPENLVPVLRSFQVPKKTTFRVNTLVAPVEQIVEEVGRLKCNIDRFQWTGNENVPVVFEVEPGDRDIITHSKIIDEGKIYVQNVSSMLAPIVLDPQPGEVVLDLAAAPGGKTIQIAQQMKNQGVLSAVEPIRNRMFRMKANLKRCGVHIVKTYQIDGRTVGKKTPERFDRVLLDAPCSSEARFRAGVPDSWSTWGPRKLRECSRKQIGLLKAAIHATKIGGRIVYCTCSFSLEENERVLEKVCKKFGDAIEIMPVVLPIENGSDARIDGDSMGPEAVRNAKRILPTNVMDGFFLAAIQKHRSTSRVK